MPQQPSSQGLNRSIYIVIALSAFVHAVTFLLAKSSFSQWRWQHIPFHSAIEVFGGAIALFVCFLLLNLEKNNRGTSFNIPIAAAVGAMGILDVSHALVEPGKLFVWFHSTATFFGGVFFLLIILPVSTQTKLKHRFTYGVLSATFLLSIASFSFPQLVPDMVVNGRFSSFAVMLNTIGGTCLLIASIKLYATYKQHKKTDDLLFILHSSMFGLAAIMFQQSFLWDLSWWGWHLLRLLAYGVALWFALLNEKYLFAQLKQTATTAAKQVEITEQQQAAILAGLNDAVVVVDSSGKIKLFSKSAEAMFDIKADTALTLDVNQLIESKEHKNLLSAFTQLLTKQKTNEYQIKLAGIKYNGATFPIDITVTQLELEGETHFVTVIRDITVQVEQKRKLKQAVTAAESANIAKSAFLANTSHEIRTPMHGLYGNLQLLRELTLPPAAEQYVHSAISCSKNLMVIINDILDFSKIEAGKLDIEKVQFDLIDLLENIRQEMQNQANQKGLSLVFDNSISDRFWLGDPVRIYQVLSNITSNAFKFTPTGSIIFNAEYCSDSEQLKFIVKDTGIGMSEAQVDRLFNRFEQADITTTRKYGGTGLGMSITKSLVGLMQGDISVQSDQDSGSTFTVTLPAERSDNQQANNSPPGLIKDLSHLHILLVEDNVMNQMIANAMLADTNVKITLAENGQIAIDKLNDDIDLVLMDIQMPVMDGIEATGHIKNMRPDLIVIALTANVSSTDVALYHSTGFADVIAKPVDKEQMLSILYKHI
ncbi:MAG: hypothetical protein CMK64_10635 [Pseudoalteromonas sp.]|nr:hypothetical protein [Pseudoalteromonas sp.]